MSKDYKVVIHTAQCLGRFNGYYEKAQKWLDNEVIKDSDQYVPMDTGALRNSAISGTKLGSGEVIYNTPYARAMYYGTHLNFSKDKHPKACAQWFEKAKAEKKTAWENGVEKIIKNGG